MRQTPWRHPHKGPGGVGYRWEGTEEVVEGGVGGERHGEVAGQVDTPRLPQVLPLADVR